ncbi:MAG: hypothetical protein Q7V62_06020, partial [Actinomycetota bacterium]|nr:hypothetical protein [Actinomycetota bacterium]
LAEEKNLTDEIQLMLDDMPIYQQYLGHIKGIGPRIAGMIVSQTMIRFVEVDGTEFKRWAKTVESDEPLVGVPYEKQQILLAVKTKGGNFRIPTIRGIGAFDTVSKYWEWGGIGMVLIDGRWYPQKRWGVESFEKKFGRKPIRNKNLDELKINYNPKMKTLAWKIGNQFIKIHGGHRDIYDHFHDKYAPTRIQLSSLSGKWEPLINDGVHGCPQWDTCKANLTKAKEPTCAGHVVSLSKRATVKFFIADLWEFWRRMEGLPVREPYVLEKMGHTTRLKSPPLEKYKVKDEPEEEGEEEENEEEEGEEEGDKEEET